MLKEWLTNRGKQADKAFKRWNDKAKRNSGFKDRAGNFQATKLVIETTSSKLLGLEVDQTAKPNQTSLALCLNHFIHRGTIKKCSQKVGFTRKTFDTKISRHDTKTFNTVKLKRTV